jgi:GDPmannose 4,6-dehydratase
MVTASGLLNLKRRAIIVGSNGQDGRLLAELLVKKEYELALVGRGQPDITNRSEVDKLVSEVNPNEIYFLAAYHHSSEDIRESDEILFKKSFDIHAMAAANYLEAIALRAPAARLFYASSSHIFPDSGGKLQNEETPARPENIYAITKYSGMLTCRYYREKRDVFASCGILFNHESILRSPSYLSRKVAIAAARISHRKMDTLVLGNLDVSVDWGYAPDYVDAMYRMLQLEVASDYVIASGKAHTVRQLVEVAFRHVGLDYRAYVQVRPDVLTKRIETRIGDSSKLGVDAGWSPSATFEQMVTSMVDAEVARL